MLAWRLALRDLARGGRGLVLLAVCVFLGTAALAGIGSLSASLVAALDAQGRTILGGDVEMRVSQRRATVAEADAFARAGRVAEVIATRAMVEADGRRGAAPVLVSLRAIDRAYPLVGTLRLAPGALADRPRGRQIAVAPALADRLGIGVGDMLRVGAARLRVIGLIADEPDRLAAGFAFGPPALVDMAGMEATALLQPGSLYDARYRIALPGTADARATGDRLVARFPNAGWTARTTEGAASGLRRAIGQLGQFLLLVGLAALAIAGVGVGSGVSAYLDGKTRMIATLKVLGARSRTIAALFLAQLAIVAGSGAAAGLALGAATPWLVAALAGDALPVPPRLALYPLPLVTAVALAGLVALGFALPALARARRVPAATLLRDAVGGPAPASWRVRGAVALIALAIAGLAVASASDRPLALGFVAGVGALLLTLAAIGRGVRAAAARLPRPRRPLFRLALANLHRPGAQTDRLVMALGLGFSLFVAIAVIDTSLSSELSGAAPARAPRFFAIDLQPSDAARFRAAVRAAAPDARFETTPSLRGSVVALRGRPVAELAGAAQASWVLRGDRTLTWSATLPPRNTIVAGRWWPADYSGPPLVSLEEGAARALGLGIGDTITVAVLGVEVPARIASLRRVDWSGLGLNFAIVFSPGYIEEAPHSLLAGVYAAPGRDGAIARQVADALPGVTLVRVGDVIGQIGALLGQIAAAIRAAGAMTVAAGLAVLIGAVAASARTRRYDAVLLKLLGGTTRQVLAAQAIEYALLALTLTALALAIGGAAGWYVVTRVFDLSFAPDPAVVAGTLAAAIAVTVLTGLAGSLPALRARPAAALRGE